jgi:hypothetical protein
LEGILQVVKIDNQKPPCQRSEISNPKLRKIESKRLSEGESSETDNGGDDGRASEARGTGGRSRGLLGGGAVATNGVGGGGGSVAGAGLLRRLGGARNVDGGVLNGGEDGGVALGDSDGRDAGDALLRLLRALSGLRSRRGRDVRGRLNGAVARCVADGQAAAEGGGRGRDGRLLRDVRDLSRLLRNVRDLGGLLGDVRDLGGRLLGGLGDLRNLRGLLVVGGDGRLLLNGSGRNTGRHLGARAVGNLRTAVGDGDDLSGVDGGGTSDRRRGRGESARGQESSDDGETHFEGCESVLLVWF